MDCYLQLVNFYYEMGGTGAWRQLGEAIGKITNRFLDSSIANDPMTLLLHHMTFGHEINKKRSINVYLYYGLMHCKCNAIIKYIVISICF